MKPASDPNIRSTDPFPEFYRSDEMKSSAEAGTTHLQREDAHSGAHDTVHKIDRCPQCGTHPTEPGQQRCGNCTAYLEPSPATRKVAPSVWIAAAIVALLVVGALASNSNPSSGGRSSNDLPIVEGAYRDCLVASGYGAANDLDQLDANGRALDRCDHLLP